jgi:hypothetical protein
MKREEHLKFCSICTNQSFDSKFGITCGLTKQIAVFEGNCVNYAEDSKEIEKIERRNESFISNKNKSINKGRAALYILSGLYVFVGFLEAFYIEFHHIIFGVIDWIIGVSFLLLAICSISKPYLSLIVGLILYIVLNIILAIIDPATIFRGLILKIIIISWLIYGIDNAREKNN